MYATSVTWDSTKYSSAAPKSAHLSFEGAPEMTAAATIPDATTQPASTIPAAMLLPSDLASGPVIPDVTSCWRLARPAMSLNITFRTVSWLSCMNSRPTAVHATAVKMFHSRASKPLPVSCVVKPTW